MIMPYFVSIIAPRNWWDFTVKLIILMFVGNLFAMCVVYLVHGQYPSGLTNQLIETTIIGLPFAFACLKIIAYLYGLQTELYRIAHTDVLTGLANRRAFIEALDAYIASGKPGSLLLVDADRFKRINDTYGHDGGDDCLRAIAAHLQHITKPTFVGFAAMVAT